MTLDGIVVGGADFGEAHRIVRLLTAEEGRCSLLARSARTSRRRFAGMLDVGTRVRVDVRRGRGDLRVMGDVDRLGGPHRARTDLDRIALLAYGCELCAALAAEGEAEPKLYRLLEVWLELLEGAATPGVAARVALEGKALTFAGVTPALRHCTECGERLDEPVMYDPAGGGGHHARCGGGHRVALEALEALEALRRMPLAATPGLAPPPEAGLLWRSVQAHLGNTLRSRALIDDLAARGRGPTG